MYITEEGQFFGFSEGAGVFPPPILDPNYVIVGKFGGVGGKIQLGGPVNPIFSGLSEYNCVTFGGKLDFRRLFELHREFSGEFYRHFGLRCRRGTGPAAG
jgi:hypothetical protein